MNREQDLDAVLGSRQSLVQRCLPDEIRIGVLLRATQVQNITTLDRSTIDRLVAGERFPAPVQVSPRRKAWRSEDVRSWLADPLGWVNF